MPRKNKRTQKKKTRPRARAVVTTVKRVHPVYGTEDGRLFASIPNSGFSNSCGPMAVAQLAMLRDGVPLDATIEVANGKIADDFRDALQCIRDATVSNSHGRDIFDEHSSDINDEPLSFDDLVHDASALILTKPMWDAIMRCSHGYFDGRAVIGAGEALDLDGLVIVRLNSDKLLEPVDGSSNPIADAKHVIFWDGHAHFEALVPLEQLLAVSQIFRFELNRHCEVSNKMKLPFSRVFVFSSPGFDPCFFPTFSYLL